MKSRFNIRQAGRRLVRSTLGATLALAVVSPLVAAHAAAAGPSDPVVRSHGNCRKQTHNMGFPGSEQLYCAVHDGSRELVEFVFEDVYPIVDAVGDRVDESIFGPRKRGR